MTTTVGDFNCYEGRHRFEKGVCPDCLTPAPRLPAALQYAGTLVANDEAVRPDVDKQVKACTHWAKVQEAEYFLKVWFAKGAYHAEVWACQNYQETLVGDLRQIRVEADNRWGSY